MKEYTLTYATYHRELHKAYLLADLTGPRAACSGTAEA